nr:AI-2E family transporter [Lentilactobacillus rapi]
MFVCWDLHAIGYLIIGTPYALLLGVVAGICNIIPYLGPTLELRQH